MPLEKHTVHIPLAKGVETKAHAFALEPPSLQVAHNVYWPKPGAISKRPGFLGLDGILGQDVEGGGTLTKVRGIATRGDELVCFAEDASITSSRQLMGPRAFSWSPHRSKWQDRGPYQGVEVTETVRTDSPLDQRRADRAQAGNCIVYAWREGGTSPRVVIQLFDFVTGTPLSDPEYITDTGVDRPRCLNVGDKLHVYYNSTTTIRVKIIDPANISGTIGNAPITVETSTDFFDVRRRGATEAVFAVKINGTQYVVKRITSAGGLTSATKTQTVDSNCQVALAYEPNLDRIAVFRYAGTADLRADLINGNTLADITMNTQIDNTASMVVSTMTAAFRETAHPGGTYRAVVYYINANTSSLKARYFGTDVANGTITTSWFTNLEIQHFNCITINVGAFAREQFTYVGVELGKNPIAGPSSDAFSTVIVREDGLVISRHAPFQATGSSIHWGQAEDLGKAGANGSALTGYEDAYATLMPSRRLLRSGALFFIDQGFKDTTLDFASSLPYRWSRLGEAIYAPGGYVAMYDGKSVTEQNFHTFVQIEQGSQSDISGTGLTATSVYNYVVIPAWYNDAGELERGTYMVVKVMPILTGSNDAWTLTIQTLPCTSKRDAKRTNVFFEVYRSEATPGLEFALYKVSGSDPTTTTGNNAFVFNDPTVASVSFIDHLPDTQLVLNEQLYLDFELDNLEGEMSSVLAQGQERLFTVKGNSIRASKTWVEGRGVAFDDQEIQIVIPQEGGKIVALVVRENQILAFKERRIYSVSGLGPSNTGDTGGWGVPELVEPSVGCVDPRSVVQYPGGVLFRSHRGIYAFNGSQSRFVGGPVEDYSAADISAAVVDETGHTVIFFLEDGKAAANNEVTDVYALAYDYLLDQWSTWSGPTGAKGAVLWKNPVTGLYHVTVAIDNGVQKGVCYWTTSTYRDPGNTKYQRQVRAGHYKTAGLQGFGRLWEVGILGEYIAAHTVEVRMGFEYDNTVVLNKTWTANVPYQIRVRPPRQKVTSFWVDIRDADTGGGALDNSADLLGLSLVIGVKSKLGRTPSNRSI